MLAEELGCIAIDDEEQAVVVSREDRLRRAFLDSKASYPRERIFTEPSWYKDPEVVVSDKQRVKDVDYKLDNMYFLREYDSALRLALSELAAEETNVGKDGREHRLLDFGMRCCIKLGRSETGVTLARKSHTYWDSVPGLAGVAAEVFACFARPDECLDATLSAMMLRGILPPYVEMLCTALQCLQSRPGLTAEAWEGLHAALDALRSTQKRQVPLVEPTKASSGSMQHETHRHEFFAGTIEERPVRSWSHELGIMGVTQERLVKVLCRHGGQVATEDTRSSVREL